MACSYHHKKAFQPSIASIEVGEIENKSHLGITFYLRNEGIHLACDQCIGENQPLCIKYCNAVGRDELRDIWSKCFRTNATK